MGKKKLDVMAKEREIFIHGQTDDDGNIIVPGCIRNGIDEASANKIFDEMAEFAKYAFNKSHAAAYSMVSYRTAYLKCYYQEELMAATLNSFLGNLDKIPYYIEDCKSLNIEVLKPSINESDTRFTVTNNKIRFGMGSVKNVGIAVIETIIKERIENGKFESFTSFCERIKDKGINKKCIESLIKAGVFDELGKNRATLLASFEGILDSINSENKNKMENQVSMFDLIEEENIEDKKYTFIELEEMNEKELLSLEKEMLGIYLSGHPLDKKRDLIDRLTNVDSLKIARIDEEMQEIGDSVSYKDGQTVKIAGIISKVKKKYTKNNKLMAFVSLDDLYGSTEIIVFDSTYSKHFSSIVEENIVLVEGRLSIREDEATKIIASSIKELDDFKVPETQEKPNTINISITNLNEEQKSKLRGAIKFFAGERANFKIEVNDNGIDKPCGMIVMNDAILKEFEEIAGKENIVLKHK